MIAISQIVFVSGHFENLNSRSIRFLEEAAKLGALQVLLWSDDLTGRLEGRSPKFPQSERRYFLEAVRYVERVMVVADLPSRDVIPTVFGSGQSPVWVVNQVDDNAAKRSFCQEHAIQYRVLNDDELGSCPGAVPESADAEPKRKKVIVTGCYDWLHSGHVRFFEEVGAYGDLYVVLGNDANIRLLKGEGHPLFPQQERRYVVGAIRFVKQALIATGQGWIDADPEIQWLKPDIYAVNEDGDRGGKREYCAQHGLEYLVLKRLPAPGLPPRSSTDLRGY